MTVLIDANGLQRSTLPELITTWQNIFITASGNPNLNFSSNTPLGNLVNILAQFTYDQETEAQNLYNLAFSITNSTGVNLDNLGVFLNVPRKAGTYTLTNVNIVTSKTVSLIGLNNTLIAPFTVSDGNGNNFVLVNSSPLPVGTTSLLFQAQNIGAVQLSPNTLTTLISIIDGVTSCNNPNPPITIGTNEETDAQYRVRLIQSTAIKAVGYLDTLEARLLAIPNVASALVLENYTNVTDSNGIPGHSIWAIVEGGTSTDIANQIYYTKSFGCGMKGSTSVIITRSDGRTTTIYFDYANQVPLFIVFTLQNNGTSPIDTTAIKNTLINTLSYAINQAADAGVLTCTVVGILSNLGINASVSNMEISSDNINFFTYLSTPNVNDIWSVLFANITINVI